MNVSEFEIFFILILKKGEIKYYLIHQRTNLK